jgi:hypothetical protein
MTEGNKIVEEEKKEKLVKFKKKRRIVHVPIT